MTPRHTARARAALALVAVLALAGCGQEGLRIESPIASPTPGVTAGLDPSPVYTPIVDIRSLDLRAQILADPRVPKSLRDTVRSCAQCGSWDPDYGDVTKDRMDDVLVPIGDIRGLAGYVAYTILDGYPRLIFAYATTGATVTIDGGQLIVDEQLFAAKDELCCATGPFEQRRYSWNGRRLVLVSDTGARPGYTHKDAQSKVIT